MKKICILFYKVFIIGSFCFLICGCTSNPMIKEEKKDNVNVVELYDRKKVDEWIKENYMYLNLAFTSCASGRKEESVTYKTLEEQMKVLTAYLQTYESKDVVKTPSEGKVKKEKIIELSKKLFGQEINLENEKEDVILSLNTGVGVSLPSFWKFEKESENIYTIYIVDFACSVVKEDNIMSIYSPGDTLKDEDLEAYNPGLIKITFKHTEKENYILSSSFLENYFQ